MTAELGSMQGLGLLRPCGGFHMVGVAQPVFTRLNDAERGAAFSERVPDIDERCMIVFQDKKKNY